MFNLTTIDGDTFLFSDKSVGEKCVLATWTAAVLEEKIGYLNRPVTYVMLEGERYATLQPADVITETKYLFE